MGSIGGGCRGVPLGEGLQDHMVQEGGDKGKQEKGEGEHQHQPHRHQGKQRTTRPHHGHGSRQAHEDHHDPEQNLAIDITKGEGASHLIGGKTFHGPRLFLLPVMAPGAGRDGTVVELFIKVLRPARTCLLPFCPGPDSLDCLSYSQAPPAIGHAS